MEMVGFLLFSQICKVCAEVLFWRVGESQSVELSCPITAQSPDLHLYHCSGHSQSTLLSLRQGTPPTVSPRHRGRLWLDGGLHSARVNATLLHLEPSDTGLYVWEMTENNSSKRLIYEQKIFLLVESAEAMCPCSSLYPTVLYTISAAAGLFLLIVFSLALAKCAKSNHQGPLPPAPIYVEMSRKEQTMSQNIPEKPSHLEEARFPVYANPSYGQAQEHHYASPRLLKMQG
uniref:Immunoglobulin V-set domain-containing protein n=1 Tax=Knipowitschia caucasica TaxID=637954 RepID=A0AAV2KK48_KNICA